MLLVMALCKACLPATSDRIGLQCADINSSLLLIVHVALSPTQQLYCCVYKL